MARVAKPWRDLWDEHAREHGLRHEDDRGDCACAEAVSDLIDHNDDKVDIDGAVAFYEFCFYRDELFPDGDTSLDLCIKKLKTARTSKARRDADEAFGKALAYAMYRTGAVERFYVAVLNAINLQKTIDELKTEAKGVRKRWRAIMKEPPADAAAA